jgi:glucose/mannose-6-phosphate isomerase
MQTRASAEKSYEAPDLATLLDGVLALPEHVEGALRNTQSLELPPGEWPGGMLVCGMGSAAMGADLARAAIGDRLRLPMQTARGSVQDIWLGPEALVVCANCSGDAEEPLAVYAAAGAVGAFRVVVASGGPLAEAAAQDGVPLVAIPDGLDPRLATTYVMAAVLECAQRCGAAPSLRAEMADAVKPLRRLARAWGPDAADNSAAKTIASTLHGYVPVIYGAGSTLAVARRWKNQINLNARAPAFHSELPEAGYNEVRAWRQSADKFAAVVLDDGRLPPRLKRRIEQTAGFVAAEGALVRFVPARGESRLERVLSLVLLGDLVSLNLAALDGVDPAPVHAVT